MHSKPLPHAAVSSVVGGERLLEITLKCPDDLRQILAVYADVVSRIVKPAAHQPFPSPARTASGGPGQHLHQSACIGHRGGSRVERRFLAYESHDQVGIQAV